MRKVLMGILVMGLLVGSVFQQVQAKEKSIGFNINFGTAFGGYLNAFELVSLGIEVDFHLGKHVMISPEVSVWSYKFKFDDYHSLAPGVILNFKLSRFFAGGGVLIMIFGISREAECSWEEYIEAEKQLIIKINAGFRTKNIKITAFVMTSAGDPFEYNLYGASIGFGF